MKMQIIIHIFKSNRTETGPLKMMVTSFRILTIVFLFLTMVTRVIAAVTKVG